MQKIRDGWHLVKLTLLLRDDEAEFIFDLTEETHDVADSIIRCIKDAKINARKNGIKSLGKK